MYFVPQYYDKQYFLLLLSLKRFISCSGFFFLSSFPPPFQGFKSSLWKSDDVWQKILTLESYLYF